MTDSFVSAADFHTLEREHAKLKEEHAKLHAAAADLQYKSYEEGRDDARREALHTGSSVGIGKGLASLDLPDNGGSIQFHVVGPSGPGRLTGGMTSPKPDFSLRIWGPPDESSSYGVHNQGGGNLTDFYMAFDLTSEGMVIHRMDVTGLRTKWDS